MEHADLVRYVATVLNALGIPYMIAGGTASIFFGEPRFTNDVDVVVDLRLDQVEAFCAKFPSSDFYVSNQAAAQAVIHRHQFNIIHPESGLKVDVILPRSAFDRDQFGHRRVRRPGDFDASFASPEDVIIKKLEYFKEGESPKHLRDITGILKLCTDPIDRAYIEQWADKLGVRDIWDAILQRLEMPEPRRP
jgi:hypothetical protein